MDVKISKGSLKTIIRKNDVLNLFRHFTNLTDIDVSLHDVEGEELLSYRKHPELSICELVKNRETKCNVLMRYSGLKALELGEPYIYQCGTMVKCSIALMFDEEYVGSIVCGPVLLWDVDEIAKKEMIEFCTLNCNKSIQIEEILKNVKQLKPEHMRSAALMLNLVVNHMIKDESLLLKQRNQISKQQNQIASLLVEKKVNAKTLETIENKNKLNQSNISFEKELISFIQLGDNENANAIINNILGEIFMISSGNLDAIKTNLYELFAMLIRAAVDAGCKLDEQENILNKVSMIINSDTDYEKVCYLTTEVMKEMKILIFNNRKTKKSNEHLTDAISYIRSHYDSNLSLETVSKEIYVSSYYLSHLFRDEINITFVDYINKVRIEKSKILLRKNNLNINEIATRVGFSDQNYFTKTFKKYMGITPTKYNKIFH